MPPHHPLLDDLPFCLARTALNFRRFNDQTLRTVGLESLAPGYASVLQTLDELGDCTIKRLVEQTHLPNGTLTGLLDGLERDGYLQRVPNRKDGRSWLIQLTKTGQQLCAKLRVRHTLVMDIFREVFSDAEAVELARLLGKITERMRLYAPEIELPKKAVVRRKKTGACKP